MKQNTVFYKFWEGRDRLCFAFPVNRALMKTTCRLRLWTEKKVQLPLWNGACLTLGLVTKM